MDESLEQHATHSANETEGSPFGLELARLRWVVLAFGASLIPGWILLPVVGFKIAAAIFFGPSLVIAVIQFLWFQDKPPGWLRDWADTRLTGAHLTPLQRLWK